MYNNAIPQATDVPANSQAQLLANFQAIKTLVDINHGTFSAADEGKHKFLSMPEQGGASPATVVNEMAVFCKQSPYTLQSALFLRKENNGSVTEWTSYADSGVDGWTRLPSGILLKWGLETSNGSTNILFPAAVNIPAFTAIFSMYLTVTEPGAGDTNHAIRLSAFNILGFTAYGSSRTAAAAAVVPFTYLAIGI